MAIRENEKANPIWYLVNILVSTNCFKTLIPDIPEEPDREDQHNSERESPNSLLKPEYSNSLLDKQYHEFKYLS